jgi:hypothetical protein
MLGPACFTPTLRQSPCRIGRCSPMVKRCLFLRPQSAGTGEDPVPAWYRAEPRISSQLSGSTRQKIIEHNTDALPIRRPQDAFVVRIDRERPAFHLDFHAVFCRRLRRYSPRVPAGEASPILEGASLDDLPLGVRDGERRLARPRSVDHQAATNLAAYSDQR